MLKRLFDIFFASFFIIILSPVMITVTIFVRIKLGSPVIFKQLRPGLHSKLFYIYKFRTMTDERDQNGELLSYEERLTPFGRLLRRLSLDELLQLFNVIKGDLSLVGPRPLLVEYLNRYTPEQARRHEVKPGITGWTQVNGRNEITWEEKFKLDVWYVDNQSFLLDLKILILTLIKIFRREGIGYNNQDTTPDFMGKQDDKDTPH